MNTLLIVSTGLFIIGMIVAGIVFALMRSKANKEAQVNNEEKLSDDQENEKRAINNFISEHPNFTEDSLKKLLKQYADQLIIRKPTYKCSQEVCKKAPADARLTEMQSMSFKEIKIKLYKQAKLGVAVTYTNYVQDYTLGLIFDVMPNAIQLEKYEISK